MIFFLVVLVLTSVFHIGVIVLQKENLRRISKCLLMPLIIAAYVAGGGTGRFFLPVIALIMGWLGDVLLLKISNKKFFILGLASFLLGHLFYIFAFAGIVGADVNIPAILIFAPPTVVLGTIVFRLIKPGKEMFVPVIFYMIILVSMNFFGFQVFLLSPGIAGLLILSGCFYFMVSDTVLAYYTFKKLKISGSVFIMSFYILAQTEIVLGLLLL